MTGQTRNIRFSSELQQTWPGWSNAKMAARKSRFATNSCVILGKSLHLSLTVTNCQTREFNKINGFSSPSLLLNCLKNKSGTALIDVGRRVARAWLIPLSPFLTWAPDNPLLHGTEFDKQSIKWQLKSLPHLTFYNKPISSSMSFLPGYETRKWTVIILGAWQRTFPRGQEKNSECHQGQQTRLGLQ